MAHIKDFIKHELTLCIAFIAAAVSCCLVPPDAAYLGYVDLRTLALLFAALCLKLVRPEQVRDAGGFLVSLLPLLFISPVVGLLENWDIIRGALLPIALLVAASTVLTFGISGRIAQWRMRKEDKTHG